MKDNFFIIKLYSQNLKKLNYYMNKTISINY